MSQAKYKPIPESSVVTFSYLLGAIVGFVWALLNGVSFYGSLAAACLGIASCWLLRRIRDYWRSDEPPTA